MIHIDGDRGHAVVMTTCDELIRAEVIRLNGSRRVSPLESPTPRAEKSAALSNPPSDGYSLGRYSLIKGGP